MNSSTHPSSLFFLRIKNEFAENLKLLLVLWGIFGVIVWSFYQWWFSPNIERNSYDEIAGISMLLLAIAFFLLVSTMFKRDDLKNPQDFWITRPIRSLTFFGAKLIFAWLTIALPCAVLMTLIGLIAGVGFTAVWHGLETMLWTSLATNLLALSCMAFSGNRFFLLVGSFFGGLFFVSILANNPPLESSFQSYGVDAMQLKWNTFIMLIALNLWFGWKCVWLMRNRHAKLNMLSMTGLGFVTVIIIAFIPLPGSLHSVHQQPRITLNTITRSVSPASFNGSGEKYGAKFASFSIVVPYDDAIQGDDWDVFGTDLVVVGQDNQLFGFETSKSPYVDRDGKTVKTNIALVCSVFDRRPGSTGHMSSGNFNYAMQKIIEGIPKRKIRIQGAIKLNQIHYRELIRGPLDQPFSKRDGGVVCTFDPKPSVSSYNASWKSYSPPSLFSEQLRRDRVRFRIESPMQRGDRWIQQLEGGSSGSSFLFGNYTLKDLRIEDNELGNDYFWRQYQENSRERSERVWTVQEWKKEARLVIEKVENAKYFLMPVDVEIEVPDPDKVRDLLRNGTL